MAENKLKSLDDIVFEHKNKSYGAYRLRQTERGYLLRAFFIGTTIFVVFVLLLYYYNRWQAGKAKQDKSVTVDLTDINIPEEEKEEIYDPKDEPPPPPPVQQEEVASIKVVIPEPKKNVVREETVPEVKETEGKAIDTKTQDGAKTNDAATNAGKQQEGEQKPKPKEEPDLSKDNTAFDKVDEDAVFSKGNVTQYISQFIEYTDRARDNGTQGNILIKFVVERDGSITNVRVASKKLGDGLDEMAIKAVQRTSKMWKPGKINGQPVRTNFRLPITFRLPPE